jgi:tetratricopeptide (TPR) repeat protein
LDEAIRLDPNYAIAWFNKGIAFGGLGWELKDQSKYNESLQALDKAIELNPLYANAWYFKGLTLKVLGRIPDANAAFAKARELGYNG